MHHTNRQLKFYILFCITQLVVWFFWASDWEDVYYCGKRLYWSGFNISNPLTFTGDIAAPFLLGVFIFAIFFLPFYLRKEDD